MVTKRKFLIMTVMMFVLLFMFQFTQVIKERGNQYNVNDFREDSGLNQGAVWTANVEKENPYVVFVGDAASSVGAVVSEWCGYRKQAMVTVGSFTESPEEQMTGAKVVLLDANHLDAEKDAPLMRERMEKGVSFVFCNLPKTSTIEAYTDLKKILGITEIRQESVTLQGIELFSGFLVGGQEIYVPKDEKETRERQDLDLDIPWYLTGNATKTYMVGRLDDKSVKNEELPAIIWRNSLGEGKMFAVNGDYMSDVTGIGILDSMMAELFSYELYPIVNAQSLSIANFPGVAAENTKTMNRLYTRNQIAVFRDILWPSLCATLEKSNSKLTCFLAPQFDYQDGNEPQKDELIFYMKQLKEKDAEVGMSLDYANGSGVRDKLEKDDVFLEKAESSYQFTAAYATTEQLGEVDARNEYPRFETIDTIVAPYETSSAMVSYLNEETLRQSVTSKGITHTYGEDLRLKSIETALGYSNIVMDMSQITWPQKEEDRWEIVSEKFSSNINTFWKPFDAYEKTTVSQSDERVRGFLAMDYRHTRNGNVIRLDVDKKAERAWLLLRTHDEDIEKVQGGTYKEVEEDVYIICAERSQVEITVKNRNAMKYLVD